MTGERATRMTSSWQARITMFVQLRPERHFLSSTADIARCCRLGRHGGFLETLKSHTQSH